MNEIAVKSIGDELLDGFISTEQEETSLAVYTSAVSLKVIDDQSKETAANMIISIKESMDTIKEGPLAQMKTRWRDRWQRLQDAYNRQMNPLENAEKDLRGKIKVYETTLMQMRQEEERKARMAAEEAARKEQERILAQAAKAEAAGKNGKAEALLEKAEDVYVAPVAVPVPEKTTQIASGSMTTRVDIEVTMPTTDAEIRVLCAAIVAGDVPFGVVEFSKAKLKQWAKLNQIKGAKYGCVFMEVAGSSIRRK